jgi:excisionase family DNA binding protein
LRKTASNDDVVSTREAAERLGVALRTVQLWVESGVLPAWKTAGGHRRIARSAVESLLGQRRRALGEASVVTMPAAVAPQKVSAGSLKSQVNKKSGTGAMFHILTVEDEPDLRQLIVMNIEGWGLPVVVEQAGDGFEALLRLGMRRPDLLITDLHMPGMDGFRMLHALAAESSPMRDLEVVVVTALGADDIAARGGLPPGAQVFTKPVPFDRLEALVRQRLALRAAAA